MNFIDLFAGAGGLSEGFIRAGFTPIAHVEMDKAACYTLKTRVAYHYLIKNGQKDVYVAYLKGDITRGELYDSVPAAVLNAVINLPIGSETNRTIYKKIDELKGSNAIDLIIGGPPCQAYSLVGRARSKNGMEGDPRNFLYKEYAKYLKRYQPKAFVFENVLGLKSAKGGKYLEDMESVFFDNGYLIKLFTVDASDFGVLQKRRRVIIIGWQKGLQFNIPSLEEITVKVNATVRAILSDLPPLLDGGGKDKNGAYKSRKHSSYLADVGIRNGIEVLTQHICRPHTDQDKEIYRIAVEKWNNEQKRLDYNDLPARLKTHRNRTSFFDRFKIVAANLPYSQTIVAHIAKDGHYYIHPSFKQNRSISIREAARLQSFPDDYYFEGVKENSNRTAAFKQIGNAVPPLMSFVIANKLAKLP